MKLLLLPFLAPLATSQLVLPQVFSKLSNAGLNLQNPNPQIPNNMPLPTADSDKPAGSPLLADVLPIPKQISIFSGFTRSIESISARMSDSNQNTTILAPSNSAISALPRKPWEDPNDVDSDGNFLSKLYQGIAGEDRATKNLRRFVEAHCVGVSPWTQGEGGKVKTLEGNEVWWDEEGGVKKIYPDNIEVEEVKSEVTNGQIWILKGVVNY